MASFQAARPAVLIVDDEQDLRELLASVLQDHGFAVATAEPGEAALALLAATPSGPTTCAVLLDLMLPRRSGLNVLRALARQGSAVPV